MNKHSIVDRIDTAIRFFLYLLIFWLPYSAAVVESCVITSLILWIIKRSILYRTQVPKDFSFKSRPINFLRSFSPKSNLLNIPIVFFIIACFLSVMASSFFEHALRGFITKTLEWFVIYFLVLEVFTDKKYIRIALAIFLFTAFATCLDSIIQFHITHKDIFNGRVITRGGATAAFKHANSLGGYLTFVVPLVFSYLFVQKQRKFIGYFLCFFAISLWSTIISFSRGSWIGISFGILLFLSITKRKLLFRGTVILMALIICLFAFSNLDIKNRFRIDHATVEHTIEWRKNLWLDTITMIKDRPFFGHGINIFMRLFQEYRRKSEHFYYYSPTYAHNSYLQLTAEVGIAGLLCFLWIMGRLFKTSIEMISKTVQWDLNLNIAGLLCGVFAFLIHSIFDTNFYSLQLSALFWFMIGIIISIFNLLNPSETCGKKIGQTC